MNKLENYDLAVNCSCVRLDAEIKINMHPISKKRSIPNLAIHP